MGPTNNISNKPMLNIKVGADYDIYVTNDDLDVKGEAHALMTLHQHVIQRMSELVKLIADSEPVLTEKVLG